MRKVLFEIARGTLKRIVMYDRPTVHRGLGPNFNEDLGIFFLFWAKILRILQHKICVTSFNNLIYTIIYETTDTNKYIIYIYIQ